MAYDSSFGRDPQGGWCSACRKPIEEGDKTVRISFPNDADGRKGLTGVYHLGCSKPFNSLAHALNMLSRGPF